MILLKPRQEVNSIHLKYGYELISTIVLEVERGEAYLNILIQKKTRKVVGTISASNGEIGFVLDQKDLDSYWFDIAFFLMENGLPVPKILRTFIEEDPHIQPNFEYIIPDLLA